MVAEYIEDPYQGGNVGASEKKERDFFTQYIYVCDDTMHSWEYCKELSLGKKVLHIGCSDYPIFNVKSNMHLYLVPFAKEIHGVDPNGLEEMKKTHNGFYYNSIEDVIKTKQEFDTILVPNILEHVKNPGQMIEQLFKINFLTMFVLVPNYKVYVQSTYEKNGIFTEKIHPDHFFWFSPYTLYNLFKSQIKKIDYKSKMSFFDNQNMISITIWKK